MLAKLVMAAAILAAAGSGRAAEWSPWDDAEEPPSCPMPELSRETSPLRLFGLAAIRIYQAAVGPGLPGECQFTPSCSRYTYIAVARHGLLNGAIMGTERVTRCHGFALLGDYPFVPGGLLEDPAAGKPAPAPWLSFLGL